MPRSVGGLGGGLGGVKVGEVRIGGVRIGEVRVGEGWGTGGLREGVVILPCWWTLGDFC